MVLRNLLQRLVCRKPEMTIPQKIHLRLKTPSKPTRKIVHSAIYLYEKACKGSINQLSIKIHKNKTNEKQTLETAGKEELDQNHERSCRCKYKHMLMDTRDRHYSTMRNFKLSY